MANSNWARWIHVSVGETLSQVAIDAGIAVLVEGINERDPEFSEASDRVEIRVNGPFTQEQSHDCHKIHVDINVLVNSDFDGVGKSAYQLDTILGLYHEAMDGIIPVYRYGTGPDDDDSLVGCLRPRSGKNDEIRVLRFGQMDKTLKIKQGMVDGRYVMYLDENQ